MTTPRDRRWLMGLVVCLAAALLLTFPACAKKDREAQTERPEVEQTDVQLADDQKADEGQQVEEPDPFAVPDGTPEELLKYIEGLSNVRPKSPDRDGVMEYRKNIGQTLVEATDKILAGQPNDEQAVEAVHWKLAGLSILDQLGDAEATKKLENLPAELEKAGLSHLVRMARSALLQIRLQRAPVAGAEQFQKLIDQIKSYLAEEPPQPDDAQLAMAAAEAAEMFSETETAAGVYRDLGKILSASEDESIATAGAMMEGAARRMTLVGKTMPLEGTTLDGEPLDWAKYEGKVVLVDFWATWCKPCLAEIPNIQKNYELYHDLGFDVLGISTDRDPEALKSFLEKNELPWTVLADRHPDASEEAERMSVRYGVFSIPTVALLGQDGKVISFDVRGERLGAELERLLGPPPEEKKQSEEEDKKAPEEKAEKIPPQTPQPVDE